MLVGIIFSIKIYDTIELLKELLLAKIYLKYLLQNIN